MDLDQLHYFKIVAKTTSFTKASEELNLSQPALSRSISRLETEIGVPLFERKSRGVILNEFGHLFLKHANTAVSEIMEAKQMINDMADPEHGTISISFIQTLGSSYIPNLIREYKKKYPGIRFRLTQHITSKILEEVETAQINIGFCSPQNSHEHLNSIPILTEELFLIVPAEHRLAGKKEINLIDVSEEPFILFKQGTALHELIADLCSEAGFQPKKVFEGIEERTVTDLVEANFGVAIVPWLPHIDKRRISLISIKEPKPYRTIHMIWRKNGYLSPAVTNFLKFVESYAKE